MKRIPDRYGYISVAQYGYTISALNAYLAEDMNAFEYYLKISGLIKHSNIAFNSQNNEPINPFAFLITKGEAIAMKTIWEFVIEKNSREIIESGKEPRI